MLSSSDYIIRPITSDDNPFVKEVVQIVLTEYGGNKEGFAFMDPELDNMFNAYKNPKSVFYVIENSMGKIVGGGGFGPLKSSNSSICELQKMYFIKEIRGLGLGKKLLACLISQMKDLEFKTCYLETLSTMKQAQSLYRKFGFESIDKPLGNTGHFSCDYWMMKKLT